MIRPKFITVLHLQFILLDGDETGGKEERTEEDEGVALQERVCCDTLEAIAWLQSVHFISLSVIGYPVIAYSLHSFFSLPEPISSRNHQVPIKAIQESKWASQTFNPNWL